MTAGLEQGGDPRGRIRLALAGLLIEDVSGPPFEEYLRRAIWQPLGMDRTFITVPDSLEPDLATAYEMEDDELVRVPYEVYQTPSTSSMVSTAKGSQSLVELVQNASENPNSELP